MSQLHLPRSSLRFRLASLPSIYRRRVASLPTNSPLFSTLELNSTETTVFRSLTVVRSRFSESDITPEFALGKAQDKRKPQNRANGIFLIILINLGIFVADHFFQVRGIKSMYLHRDYPSWYQFVTATFCHANWNHLSSNLFFFYIFGKIVEEEKGNFGLWLSYLFTGVGANLVSWFALPLNSVSSGASGAVCGLFVISVLVKVFEASQASPGLLLETIFVPPLLTLIQTVKPIAQFSGALVGVLLVSSLLSKFSPEPVDQEV